MAECPKKNRERLRKFRKENPEKNRAKNAQWKLDNPEKSAAHKAVEHAIRDGYLLKQPCQRCGSEELVHGHHDDYTNKLAVIWLCPLHHQERHRLLADVESGLAAEVPHLPASGLTGQQARSLGRGPKGTTGFRGVQPRPCGTFRAVIWVGKKNVTIGTFATPDEAARAYDAKAVELFGSAARLNFPNAVAA